MVERISRQKQIIIKMLEEDRPFKAEEFKVSNQNEPLKFLEKKDLITRNWNDEKKEDFKWNYMTTAQRIKAKKFLGSKFLSDESQKSKS